MNIIKELKQAFETNIICYDGSEVEEEKDCINCCYTRVENINSPCCNCTDYSEFDSDKWMHKQVGGN